MAHPAVEIATVAGKVRSGAPIDRKHLARFTFGNLELEVEVLVLFARQAPDSLAQMEAAVTAKAWRDAAHTLKGSARAVGAWDVAAAAEQAERSTFQPDPSQRQSLIDEIRRALEEAVDYVEGL